MRIVAKNLLSVLFLTDNPSYKVHNTWWRTDKEHIIIYGKGTSKQEAATDAISHLTAEVREEIKTHVGRFSTDKLTDGRLHFCILAFKTPKSQEDGHDKKD